MNAKQSLSSISTNQDLWIEQFRQEMFERDYRSGLSAAENIGLERGLKEGRAEGKQERNIALAKKYMAMGHSAQEAAEFAEIDIELLK